MFNFLNSVRPGCFGSIGTSGFWLLYWRPFIYDKVNYYRILPKNSLPPPFFLPWPHKTKVAFKGAMLTVLWKSCHFLFQWHHRGSLWRIFFIEMTEKQLYIINMLQRQTSTAQMDSIVPGHRTSLAKLRWGRGSSRGWKWHGQFPISRAPMGVIWKNTLLKESYWDLKIMTVLLNIWYIQWRYIWHPTTNFKPTIYVHVIKENCIISEYKYS